MEKKKNKKKTEDVAPHPAPAMTDDKSTNHIFPPFLCRNRQPVAESCREAEQNRRPQCEGTPQQNLPVLLCSNGGG